MRAGILSNGDPDMLAAVVRNADLAGLARSGAERRGHRPLQNRPGDLRRRHARPRLDAAEVLFVSSNCWDAIGATWFGYTTLWINRFDLPLDELGATPTRIGTQLGDVLDFFASERPSP